MSAHRAERSGQDDLFNCITGWYRIDEGGSVRGAPSGTKLRRDRSRELGIARTYQNIRLFAGMSRIENVLVGQHHFTANGMDGGGAQDAGREVSRRRRPTREALRPPAFRRHPRGTGRSQARELPYGDQRRLEIARALAAAALLLLDEPTAGMNPAETRQMTDFIRQLRDELGITILLIEHEMRVVMGISERITVLDYGEKIAEGTPRGDPDQPPGHRGVPRDAAQRGDRRRDGRRRSSSSRPDGALDVDRITFYGNIHALQGRSRCRVDDGEIVTLIGANGAGKSDHAQLHQRPGRPASRAA